MKEGSAEQSGSSGDDGPERASSSGWCWVVVELHGYVVERPGVVSRWATTPQAWMGLVVWSDPAEPVPSTLQPYARALALAL